MPGVGSPVNRHEISAVYKSITIFGSLLRVFVFETIFTDNSRILATSMLILRTRIYAQA